MTEETALRGETGIKLILNGVPERESIQDNSLKILQKKSIHKRKFCKKVNCNFRKLFL